MGGNGSLEVCMWVGVVLIYDGHLSCTGSRQSLCQLVTGSSLRLFLFEAVAQSFTCDINPLTIICTTFLPFYGVII